MPQVTNQQLQQMIQKLTERVDKVEEKMKTYEEQAKINTAILLRVETTVNGYETVITSLVRLLKYLLGILALAAASVLAYWVTGLLHIRP